MSMCHCARFGANKCCLYTISVTIGQLYQLLDGGGEEWLGGREGNFHTKVDLCRFENYGIISGAGI